MTNKKSFSLIEIIVVTSIVIVLSGLSFVYYRSFSDKKDLDRETQKFIDVLELAKKKARTADSSLCAITPPVPTPVVGNFVVDRQSARTYRLFPRCTVGVSNEVQYTAPNYINLWNGTYTTEFKPLSGGVGSTKCLVIRHTAANLCDYVRVEANGVICSGNCSGSCAPPTCNTTCESTPC